MATPNLRTKKQTTVDAEHVEAPAKSTTLEDMFGGDDIPDEEKGYVEEPATEAPPSAGQPASDDDVRQAQQNAAEAVAQDPTPTPAPTPVSQQPPSVQAPAPQQAQNQSLPAVQAPQQVAVAPSTAQAGFDSHGALVALQRAALPLTTSDVVPERYRGQNALGSAMIALDMAMRMKVNVLAVMQNLYTVHGQPGWSAQFLIATFNASGRFTPLKYRMVGEKGKDTWGYIAVTADILTGEVIEGIEVTIAMAKAEKWTEKSGSKWKTMPELMLKYRAAAFLIRTTAPEIAMGLPTIEELKDIDPPASQQPVRRPIITDEV